MSHFDKFLLVPNEGPHPFSHPVSQTISELDKDIQSILKGGLDDHSKWRLYEQTVQRYHHLKQQATEPTRVGIQDVLDPVPSSMKVRASRLSAMLKAQGHIDWSPTGEISIDGVIIPHTHIGDLLTAAVNPRQKLKPTGWNQFVRYLPKLPSTNPFLKPPPTEISPHLNYLFKSPKHLVSALASIQSPGSKKKRVRTPTNPGKIEKRRSARSRVVKWEKLNS